MARDYPGTVLERLLLTDGVKEFRTGSLGLQCCLRRSRPDRMLRGRALALSMLRGGTKDLRCRGIAQLGDATPPIRVRRGGRRFTS